MKNKILTIFSILLFSIAILLFAISPDVYAYSSSSDELTNLEFLDFPASTSDVLDFLQENEGLYNSLITYNEIITNNCFIYFDGGSVNVYINYGNTFNDRGEFNSQNWFGPTMNDNSVYMYFAKINGYGGVIRYQYSTYDSSFSQNTLENYSSRFISNYDLYYNDDVLINKSFPDDLTMQGVVENISLNLGVDDLFTIVGYAVDIIVIAVMFVLGYMIIRKILKKLK